MTNPLDELSRNGKVMLFAYGVLTDLINKGFVDGGETPLTLKGLGMYDQLKSTGFRPTRKEVVEVLRSGQFVGNDQFMDLMRKAMLDPDADAKMDKYIEEHREDD